MSKLRPAIVQTARPKNIRALVIDVLGSACSVRLGTTGTGKLMRNLAYIGLRPNVGDIVLVDYQTGTPRVITTTTGEDIENLIDERSGTIVTNIINNQDNGGGTQPEVPEVHHNDLDDLQGGIAPDEGQDAEYYHLTEDELLELQDIIEGGGSSSTCYVPVTNGDPISPDLVYDCLGDVVLTEYHS